MSAVALLQDEDEYAENEMYLPLGPLEISANLVAMMSKEKERKGEGNVCSFWLLMQQSKQCEKVPR